MGAFSLTDSSLLPLSVMGARFRFARRLTGLTQEEVARSAKVALRTYQDWERGIARPSAGSAIRRVAEVLRTSVGWLLEGYGKGPDGYEHATRDEGFDSWANH